MVKRTQRPGPRPARKDESARQAWPTLGHSGEGSASALEVLRNIEQSKHMEARPADQLGRPPAAVTQPAAPRLSPA